VKRLDREDVISEMMGFDYMLPCPGQGAIAVQCSSTGSLSEVLEPIHDEKTFLAVLAERSYLSGLGGGCSLPVAAFAEVRRKTLTLTGCVIAPDGSEKHLLSSMIDIPDDMSEAREAAERLGLKLGKIAIEDGAAAMMGLGL
jgi:hydroxymethylbilane synthase